MEGGGGLLSLLAGACDAAAAAAAASMLFTAEFRFRCFGGFLGSAPLSSQVCSQHQQFAQSSRVISSAFIYTQSLGVKIDSALPALPFNPIDGCTAAISIHLLTSLDL